MHFMLPHYLLKINNVALQTSISQDGFPFVCSGFGIWSQFRLGKSLDIVGQTSLIWSFWMPLSTPQFLQVVFLSTGRVCVRIYCLYFATEPRASKTHALYLRAIQLVHFCVWCCKKDNGRCSKAETLPVDYLNVFSVRSVQRRDLRLQYGDFLLNYHFCKYIGVTVMENHYIKLYEAV